MRGEGEVAPIDPADQPFVHEPRHQDLNGQLGDHTLHLARTLYDDGVLLRHCPSLAPMAPGSERLPDPGPCRFAGGGGGR